MRTIGPYYRGEVTIPLKHNFQDSDGGNIDITGYNARAVLEFPDGTSTVLTSNITVSDGPEGEVTYTFDGAETADLSQHSLQLWVSNGVQKLASHRFYFDVEDVAEIPTF